LLDDPAPIGFDLLALFAKHLSHRRPGAVDLAVAFNVTGTLFGAVEMEKWMFRHSRRPG
jgi:hypothetical protein